MLLYVRDSNGLVDSNVNCIYPTKFCMNTVEIQTLKPVHVFIIAIDNIVVYTSSKPCEVSFDQNSGTMDIHTFYMDGTVGKATVKYKTNDSDFTCTCITQV